MISKGDHWYQIEKAFQELALKFEFQLYLYSVDYKL